MLAVALCVPAMSAHAGPTDPHVYAEDLAHEIAAILRPGARVQIEPSDGYFEMAVEAQLRMRNFAIIPAGEANGQPLHYTIQLGAAGGQATIVRLLVGLDAIARSYNAATGKPLTEWVREVPVQRPAPVASAQSERDQLYTLGRSVEASNADRAITYYRQASDLGQHDASLRLGVLLVSKGQLGEGMVFVRRASDAGNARANYVLGVATLGGDGVPKDVARGRVLLLQARDRGFPAAAQALADLDGNSK